MRKKLIAAMMAGVLSAGMFSTGVFAADTDLKGEVNTFIAASLSNAMEEIQKDFNETYPDVEILYNADSSGTLQTQIEEGARCDIFFSAADKQMDALVDEDLAKKDTVEDILENKVVLIKPKDGETKVTGFENITDAANIALAGDSVPVGQYSREIFDNLGITDEVNKMEINEGKNVYEETGLYREPNVEQLDNEVVRVGVSAGSSVYQVRYFDTINSKISEIYYTPWDEYNNKLIRFENKKMIIQDMFDKSNYYKEVKLDMRDTAEPNSAIKSAEFLDDNTVKVTYFSEDDEEITKKIKL